MGHDPDVVLGTTAIKRSTDALADWRSSIDLPNRWVVTPLFFFSFFFGRGRVEGCDVIPVENIKWSDQKAIAAVTLAVVGLLATLATALVFAWHNETPVVKVPISIRYYSLRLDSPSSITHSFWAYVSGESIC